MRGTGPNLQAARDWGAGLGRADGRPPPRNTVHREGRTRAVGGRCSAGGVAAERCGCLGRGGGDQRAGGGEAPHAGRGRRLRVAGAAGRGGRRRRAADEEGGAARAAHGGHRDGRPRCGGREQPPLHQRGGPRDADRRDAASLGVGTDGVDVASGSSSSWMSIGESGFRAAAHREEPTHLLARTVDMLKCPSVRPLPPRQARPTARPAWSSRRRPAGGSASSSTPPRRCSRTSSAAARPSIAASPARLRAARPPTRSPTARWATARCGLWEARPPAGCCGRWGATVWRRCSSARRRCGPGAAAQLGKRGGGRLREILGEVDTGGAAIIRARVVWNFAPTRAFRARLLVGAGGRILAPVLSSGGRVSAVAWLHGF